MANMDMAQWELIMDTERVQVWVHPSSGKVILDQLRRNRYMWEARLADGRQANGATGDLVTAQAQALVHASLTAEEAAKL